MFLLDLIALLYIKELQQAMEASHLKPVQTLVRWQWNLETCKSILMLILDLMTLLYIKHALRTQKVKVSHTRPMVMNSKELQQAMEASHLKQVQNLVMILNVQLGERSRLAWLEEEADPMFQSDSLLKVYSRPSEDVNRPSSKWFISKNAIVLGLGLLGIKQGTVDSVADGEPAAPKTQKEDCLEEGDYKLSIVLLM